MAIFALSDPHLSFASDKPMDVFGPAWVGHAERIRENWLKSVSNEDLVLIPGDISWALTLDEAIPDLAFLHELPGRKLLLRGNHDYWWVSLSKIRKRCADEGFTSLFFLQNEAFDAGDGIVIAGSRGWLLPHDPAFSAEDGKIFERECIRLQISLQAAAKLSPQRLIVMTHYPPLDRQLGPSAYSRLMEEAGAELCVFGHIHQKGTRYTETMIGENGLRYILTACDRIDFCPLRLA